MIILNIVGNITNKNFRRKRKLLDRTKKALVGEITPEKVKISKKIAYISTSIWAALTVAGFLISYYSISRLFILVFPLWMIFLIVPILSISRYFIERSVILKEGKPILYFVLIYGMYQSFFLIVLFSASGTSMLDHGRLLNQLYDYLTILMISSQLPMLFGLAYVFAKSIEVETPDKRAMKERFGTMTDMREVPTEKESKMITEVGIGIVLISFIISVSLWISIFSSLSRGAWMDQSLGYLLFWISTFVFGIGVKLFISKNYVKENQLDKIWIRVFCFIFFINLAFIIWIGVVYTFADPLYIALPLSASDLGFRSILFFHLFRSDERFQV